MELGALICTPRNPSCSTCPLQQACRAFRGGGVDAFPKRLSKKPVPHYRIAVGVVSKNGRLLITRRKPSGLLGGLWEFPGGKIGKEESAEQACIREIKEEVNLAVTVESYLTRIKHAYTHFKITMDIFRCRYQSGRIRLNGPVDYRWINLSDIDTYPFPRANAKFIPLLKGKP